MRRAAALGLGIAIKCDDGAGRAAEAIIATLIARFLPLDDAERAALANFAQPTLRNWNGIEVGALPGDVGVARRLKRVFTYAPRGLKIIRPVHLPCGEVGS